MKQQITAYREQILLTSLVILIPTFTNALLWQRIVWYPFLELATHWIVLFFILRDRVNAEQNPRVMRLVFWLVPVTSLLVGGIQVLARSGFESFATISTITYVVFGLLFFVLGNSLPKVKQNSTIGIRVKWSLENEENWNATHRFAGKVWVTGGLLAMACALLPASEGTMVLFTVVILALTFAPMCYSYRYYRRQLAAGTIAPSPVSRKGAAAVAVLVVAIGAFTGWALFSGSMQITLTNDALQIETPNWKDLTIPYDTIDSATYYDHDPSKDTEGARTNGFDNLRFAMGRFTNTFYGDYTRYTHADCDACIILEVDGETIVLNEADTDNTNKLYEELQKHLG